MEILVLAPYEEKTLKALTLAKRLNLGNIIVVGNKKKIYETCFRNKIKFQNFDIIDCEGEIDIINFAKNYLLEEADYVILGNISLYYQKKLFSMKQNDDFNYINIIDFPLINHFLFITNFPQKEVINFEDKKKTIVNSSLFMNKLGIKKTNLALVSTTKTKADSLESNIIKMTLKDPKYQMINILDSYKLYDLFERNSLINIYRNNINLLLFRNFDSSHTFIETLHVLGNCKIASILLYSNYNNNYHIIDSSDVKNENNLLFAMLIFQKIIIAKEKNIKINS